MRFFRDCGRGPYCWQLRAAPIPVILMYYRTLRFSTFFHALFYLRGAEPLHPCSRPRGATLQLLSWMACMTVVQEQKKHYFKWCP
jgi:hypothetical protein